MFGDQYPDLPFTEDLPDHWRELGFGRVMPMGGYGPFEWQEVHAYNDASGAGLGPAELQTLVDMSRAYASGLADTNPLSIQPMERRND